MTDFKPGDRVTDGKKILWVQYCHKTDYRLCVSDSPDGGMHYPVQPSNLRPAWQECKDCNGHGEYRDFTWITCPTCKGTGRKNRTGPYKLQSGEWSDGVDRKDTLLDCWRNGMMQVWFHREIKKWRVNLPGNYDAGLFPTFEEAITYAHKKAREVAE